MEQVQVRCPLPERGPAPVFMQAIRTCFLPVAQNAKQLPAAYRRSAESCFSKRIQADKACYLTLLFWIGQRIVGFVEEFFVVIAGVVIGFTVG